jgi:hypothetical protein
MRTLLFIVPRAAPERDAHRSISKCARPTRQAANTPVTRARQEALSLSPLRGQARSGGEQRNNNAAVDAARERLGVALFVRDKQTNKIK